MASNKPRFRRERGFSLLELLIAIGIACAIVGVMIVLFSNVRESQRDRDAVTELHSLVAVIRHLYKTPDYTSLSGPVLSRASSLAHAMADSSGNLIAPWGTPITLGPATYGGNTGGTFQMVLTQVPTTHCVSLLRNSTAFFLRIQVGATVLKDMSVTPAVDATDLGSIVEACKGPGNPDVTVISS